MKKLLLLLFSALFTIQAFSETIEYNGLFFSIRDDNTCTVVSDPSNPYGCYSGEIVIPEEIPYGQNTYRVTAIGDAAFMLSSMTSVTIPNSVTHIGTTAFSSCFNITSVTIPSSVSYIGDMAFISCLYLQEIIVEEDNANYSSMDGILFNHEKTTLIQCPGAKTEYVIPNTVTTIGISAFKRCTSLTSVIIPNSVTQIGESAFSYCESLTSVTIPNTITQIGEYTFYSCSSLTSVTIPNSVTQIGESAFSFCTNLTAITIPNSVTEIGEAFRYCTSLKDVYYAAEHPVKGSPDTFDYNTYAYATLHIPETAIDVAKTISPWMYFNSIEAYDFGAGIESVTIDDDPAAPVTVYNLSGIKVFEGQRCEISLPRGYYIINGKKCFVK